MLAETSGAVPRSVGLIVDGNRRWGDDHKLLPGEGHRFGTENLKHLAKYVLGKAGIEYLTAFVLSEDNRTERDQEELEKLYQLLQTELPPFAEECRQLGHRIVHLGRQAGLDESTLEKLRDAEAITAEGKNGTLGLAFNYDGDQEIVDAFNMLIDSGVDRRDINGQMLRSAAYHPEIPALDMMIRTGGRRRLSGFMLIRVPYTELFFSTLLFPDLRRRHIDEMLNEFGDIPRNFGR